jgi:hypothetical protein
MSRIFTIFFKRFGLKRTTPNGCVLDRKEECPGRQDRADSIIDLIVISETEVHERKKRSLEIECLRLEPGKNSLKGSGELIGKLLVILPDQRKDVLQV